MKVTSLFKQGKFVVTCEVGPPKGIEVDKVLDEFMPLRGRMDAFNVTDLQSAVMKVGSMAVCRLLKERGLEPIMQMACRDRNRLALQSDVLSAAVLGIENLLCLSGDHPRLGDHPQAMPVFDLDSVQLLSVVKTLMSGKDMAGNDLQGKPPQFALGAVVNPGEEPLEPQLIKMEKKVAAGAEFFQTQPVYEPCKFADFMDKIKHLNVPVMAGIVFLKSPAQAAFMNANIAGIHVPDEIVNELASVSKEQRVEKNMEISARLIKQLRDLCQGIHIMSLGWERHITTVLEMAGL
ncbi:MAG: 5,10-methylenetetrahydrofolate reductase [Planctomycetes bacterium RBG_13_44_8b]|nr:MAG: 5,10-methylenetetrahydrofolate reductase [Planctomycetes bacterium RBG_13_44_8b]